MVTAAPDQQTAADPQRGQSSPRVALFTSSGPNRRQQWVREQMQRIGLWGSLNTINQHLASTRARMAEVLGGDVAAEAQNMTPDEIAAMAENLPIGSSVTVNHARDDTVQQQQNIGAKGAKAGWIAAGVLGAALAGLAGYGLGGGGEQQQPQQAAPVVRDVPVVLEWEIPNVYSGGISGSQTQHGSTVSGSSGSIGIQSQTDR